MPILCSARILDSFERIPIKENRERPRYESLSTRHRGPSYSPACLRSGTPKTAPHPSSRRFIFRFECQTDPALILLLLRSGVYIHPPLLGESRKALSHCAKRHIRQPRSSLLITDTCVILFASSSYSFSKFMPMDSAVLKEPTFVYLQ